MAFTQISTDGIKNGSITGSDFATNIDLTDSQKIRFGNSNDLQLFHDGNNSVITAGGAGDLQLTSTFDDVIIQAADNIFINPQGGETGLQVYGDGAVKLYHANAQKFETTTTGAKITHTGNAALEIVGGEGYHAQIYMSADEGDDANDKWLIDSQDAGKFVLYNYSNGSSWEKSIIANAAGSVELYHDNNKKFETLSTGVQVTGKLQIDRTVSATSGDHPALEIETLSSGSENSTFATGIDFKVDGVFKKRLAVTRGSGEGGGDWVLFKDQGVNQALVIDSSGRIRTGGASSFNASTNADDLQIGASGQSNQTGISLGSASASSIRFMDVANDSAGFILYNHGNDALTVAGTSSVEVSAGGLVLSVTSSDQVLFEVGSTAKFQRNTGGTNSNAVLFNTAGSLVGKIFFNNSETAYITSGSDRTLKKNFENWTESVLPLFKNLTPQKFNFTQEEDSETKHKGFIAQDEVASFPEAYPKDPDTDKYLYSPNNMVVYLMKAIQELEAEVAALKAA